MCRRLYQKCRTATYKTLSATRDTTLYATRYTEFIQNYMWHNIRHYLQHYIRHTIYSIICGTLSTALYTAHHLQHYIQHTIYSIIYDTLYTALPLVQHSLCLSILCVPHKTMDRHSIPNFLIYLQIVLLCIPRIRAAFVLLPPACSIAWAKHASVISLLIFSWPGSS